MELPLPARASRRNSDDRIRPEYSGFGNSGPLKPEIAEAVTGGSIVGTSVLSGNRNFEGRIHPMVQHNFLASPPLVVAYALAGNMNVDLYSDALGQDQDGKSNPADLSREDQRSQPPPGSVAACYGGT